MKWRRPSETRFSHAATVEKPRSGFPMSFRHWTTCNSGELVPMACIEVLPGDTWRLDPKMLLRMLTPKVPTMDTAWVDTFAFFIPNRLVWSHWREFNGENTSSAYVQQAKYYIPFVDPREVTNDGHWSIGGFADNINTNAGPGSEHCAISALPMRGYWLTWNEYFRDQNLQDPLEFSMGDDGNIFLSPYEDITSPDQLLPVNKYHDLFTSASIAPQKGPAVSIGLVQSNFAPVVTRFEEGVTGANPSLRMRGSGSGSDLRTPGGELYNVVARPGDSNDSGSIPNRARVEIGVNGSNTYPATSLRDGLYPSNLWADITDSISSVTINDLRLAFQMQKYYEGLSRSGSRYVETLRFLFGVEASDASLQRPQYLGGSHDYLNVEQVIQTSATTPESPQGNVGAFSKTRVGANYPTYSFTEHGYIHIYFCIRPVHSYQQGIARHLLRRSFEDFYNPILSNIGEQPILMAQIYASEDRDGHYVGDEVFGYGEAWSEYRYLPSYVSGMLRTNSQSGLDIYHYGDYYDEPPVLSDGWIREDPSNIGRSLMLETDVSPQFVVQCYVDCYASRVMPTYSIPGLIDHH